MTYQIALNFEDGVTSFINANPGESVADAAYRQGVNIPLDCRDGACGTCKAFCQSGRFDAGFYIEDALTDDEAAEGYCLPCQMKPESNLVIDIPASSAVCKVQPADTVTEVVGIEQLSENRVRLSVKAVDGKLPNFLPGQYVNVTVPGTGTTRSYSFSSLPGAEVATFLIRNVPDGMMGSYLTHNAKIGDKLTINGPLGSFYLREPARPVVMLAGGTGVAPMLAMLELMAEKGCDQPVHLIYGVHFKSDLVEVERIEALAARIPSLSFATTVSDEAADHPLKGYVTQHLAHEALHDGNADIYLCGPPEMVEGTRHHLSEQGIQHAALHYEKFVPTLETLAA